VHPVGRQVRLNFPCYRRSEAHGLQQATVDAVSRKPKTINPLRRHDMNTSFQKTLMAAGLSLSLGCAGLALADSATVGAAITDTAITAQVKAKIADDSRTKGSDLSVTTNNGIVTITGSTPSSDAKSAVEQIAKSVDGVKSVDDEASAPSVTDTVAAKTEHAAHVTNVAAHDSWITTKVKSKLLANSLTKGVDVSVTTTDGVVALSGALPTDAAKSEAIKLAKHTKHVKSVDASALTVSST